MTTTFRQFLPLFGAAALALFATGCGESAESPGSSSGSTSDNLKAVGAEVGKAVDTAKTEANKAGAEVGKALEAAKEEASGAAKAVQQAASEAGSAVQEKLSALAAEVKKLIAEGKGSEAMQKLQGAIANLKLTPEQQKMIDDLKAQISQAVSKEGVDAAKKAVTDALKPKP